MCSYSTLICKRFSEMCDVIRHLKDNKGQRKVTCDFLFRIKIRQKLWISGFNALVVWFIEMGICALQMNRITRQSVVFFIPVICSWFVPGAAVGWERRSKVPAKNRRTERHHPQTRGPKHSAVRRTQWTGEYVLLSTLIYRLQIFVYRFLRRFLNLKLNFDCLQHHV